MTKFLKYIAAFLIPMIFVLFANQALDNDSWFILAEGREIAEDGIYYMDQLSMHTEFNVTVQQYGFAAIFYLVFKVFGAPGLYLGMLILNFAICFLLYKICMLLSNKNVNLSLFIMVITDFLLALDYVVTRPQMVSYVFFLALIYVLELYIKTDKAKYLWWVPLLSFLQINLHASVWWMLILVLGVYIVDGIRKPRLHLQGYRKKPLIVVGIVMILCGLMNPYGIKMITFIFTSYGDVRINNLVNEMRPFATFRSIFSIFVYIAMTITVFLYIFGKQRNIRIRHLLMFFGFLALGLNTTKGLSQFVLVMLVPLALVYKNVRLERVVEAEIGRNALMFWAGTMSVAIFAAMCPMTIGRVRDYPSVALAEAVDMIDLDVGNRKKEVLKIYTGYNDGGYVEYRGYRAYLDPRAEIFLKRNNGKEDLLYEWIDFGVGRISVVEFLEKYEFDYILVRGEDDPFYSLENEKYEEIFWSEEEKTRVFKRM